MSSNARRNFPLVAANFLLDLRSFVNDPDLQNVLAKEYDSFKSITGQLESIIQYSQAATEKINNFKETVYKTTGDSVVTINVDGGRDQSSDEHSANLPASTGEAINCLSGLKFSSVYEQLLKGQAEPIAEKKDDRQSTTDDHSTTADVQPSTSTVRPPTTSSANLSSTAPAQPDSDKQQSTSDDDPPEPSPTTVRAATETGKQLLEKHLNQDQFKGECSFRSKNFGLYNSNTGKFDLEPPADDEQFSDVELPAEFNASEDEIDLISTIIDKNDNRSGADASSAVDERELTAAHSDGNLQTLEDLFPNDSPASSASNIVSDSKSKKDTPNGAQSTPSAADKDRYQKISDDECSEDPSVIFDNQSTASSAVPNQTSSKPSSSKSEAIADSDEEKFPLDIDFNKIRASNSKQQQQQQPTEPEKFVDMEDDADSLSDVDSDCDSVSALSNVSQAVLKRKRTSTLPKMKPFKIVLVNLTERLIELASRNAEKAIQEIAEFEAKVMRNARRSRKAEFRFTENIKIQMNSDQPSTSTDSRFNFSSFLHSDSDESEGQPAKKRRPVTIDPSSEDEDEVVPAGNSKRRRHFSSSSGSSYDSSVDSDSDSNISVLPTEESPNDLTKKRPPKKKKLKYADIYSDIESSDDSDFGSACNPTEKEFLAELKNPIGAATSKPQPEEKVAEEADVVEQTNKENVNHVSASKPATAQRPQFERPDKLRGRKKREKTKRSIAEKFMMDNVQQRTKDESRRELDRIKRIREIQSKFNVFKEMADLSGEDSVVLEYSEKGDILVQIDPDLAKSFKAHQKDGVRFMYWNTVESLQALANNRQGNGTILAHNPGLGKTFQIISLVHCLSTNNHTRDHFKCVLVLVPKNVLANWHAEINKWISGNNLSLPLHLCHQENRQSMSYVSKIKLFNDWQEIGGILLMGHQAFSMLIEDRYAEEPADFDDRVKKAFLDPGPSIVVVDEGHEIKNSKSQLNASLNKIRTKRRIVLSGTPLQNRLEEYYHMCNFVRPYLLGDFSEYKNNFIKLIEAGQHEDSSPYEVKLMKKRIHVLQKYLGQVLHRASYEVLKKELTVTKFEYVIKLKLTSLQDQLYLEYLKHKNAEKDEECRVKNSQFFRDHRTFCNIYNHPFMLLRGKSGEKDTWYKNILVPSVCEAELESVSSKFRIFLEVLRCCEANDEKLIVFSERLDTLSFIEELLQREASKRQDPKNITIYKRQKKSFDKGFDYLRIDGETSATDRLTLINKFNDPNDTNCRLFLLSKEACAHGINLVGANRCIIFETHFNPAKDQQSICRTYRYGQTKDVYVYRFVAHGTAEEVIYAKQVQKQSLINRILDDHQSKRAFKYKEIKAFYDYKPSVDPNRIPPVPEDNLLATLLTKHGDVIVDYHEHDSLLEIIPDHDLTDEDKKQAWDEWERAEQRKEKGQNDEKSNLQEVFLNSVGLLLNRTNANYSKTADGQPAKTDSNCPTLRGRRTTPNASNVQPTPAATSQQTPKTGPNGNVPIAKSRRTTPIASNVRSQTGQFILRANLSSANQTKTDANSGNVQTPTLLNLLRTRLVTGPPSSSPSTPADQVPTSSPSGTPSAQPANFTFAPAFILSQNQKNYSNSFRPQQASASNSSEFFGSNSNSNSQQSQPGGLNPFANAAQPNIAQPQPNFVLLTTNLRQQLNAGQRRVIINSSPQQPNVGQQRPNINQQQPNVFRVPPMNNARQMNPPLFNPQQTSQPQMNQQTTNSPFTNLQFHRTNLPQSGMGANIQNHPLSGRTFHRPGQTPQNVPPQMAGREQSPNVQTWAQPNAPPRAQPNVQPNAPPRAQPNVPLRPQPNVQPNAQNVPNASSRFQRPIVIQAKPDLNDVRRQALDNVRNYYKEFETQKQPVVGNDLLTIFGERLKSTTIRKKYLEKAPDSLAKAKELSIVEDEIRLINEITNGRNMNLLFSMIESSNRIISPVLRRSVNLNVEEMD